MAINDKTMRPTIALLVLCAAVVSAQNHSWSTYGGGLDNTHYSALTQVNRDNVAQLKVAWTYDTGDAFKGSEMECNPIIVNGILYATTPKLKVIALDAATGALKWTFDPNQGRPVLSKMRNRGVTYADGTAASSSSGVSISTRSTPLPASSSPASEKMAISTSVKT